MPNQPILLLSFLVFIFSAGRSQSPTTSSANPLDRSAGSSYRTLRGVGVTSADTSWKGPTSPTVHQAEQTSTGAVSLPDLSHQGPDFANPAVYVVSNTNDTGNGSLRKAITAANSNQDGDVINFAIPGAGVHIIGLRSALPAITAPLVVDGSTQPGYTGKPLVEIDGSGAGLGVDGLIITGGYCTVRGLAINRFLSTTGGLDGHGIVLSGGGGNRIEGNFIGTDASGLVPLGNAGSGVVIVGPSSGNTIGGTALFSGNLISGNGGTGVQISTLSAGSNVIVGNLIGTDITGTVALSNTGNGVFIDAPDNVVGGTTASARNIISGNTYPGIYIGDGAKRTLVQGNYIGTSLDGLAAIPNLLGINIANSANNTVGWIVPAGRNVISGNTSSGIWITGSAATGNAVLGNYIGTNAPGSAALANTGNGVLVDDAPNNVIGGADAAARNVISGNSAPGIALSKENASGNRLLGNFVGVDVSATYAIPNGAGVVIDDAPSNTVGGIDPMASNTISGNTGYGVCIRKSRALKNEVLRNYIGTNAAGTAVLGNGGDGVLLMASESIVGGYGDEANVIAYNGGAGIFDSSGTQNSLVANVFRQNRGLGIDLAPRGLTVNDDLDRDTGPNNLLNFPLLDYAKTDPSGRVTVRYRFKGHPRSNYTIEFFGTAAADESHFGEGDVYLSSSACPILTDDAGNAIGSVAIVDDVRPYPYITAVLQDEEGNTSEFSQALCLRDADGDALPDSWETEGWGVDINADGVTDLPLYNLGARHDHKDIFVEVDAMSGLAPREAALEKVVAAFAGVPNALLNNPDGMPGINLIIDASRDDWNIPVSDFPNDFSDFDSVKGVYFGSQSERHSPDSANILKAKGLVYHYCLFARTLGVGPQKKWSGLARGTPANDFMVTLGGWIPSGGTVDQQAGTFMHELGHTLGLKHGGIDNVNFKPNYYSVMNYMWQTPKGWQLPGSRVLDYSPVKLRTLLENDLDERVGLDPPFGAYKITAIPFMDLGLNVHYALLKPGAAADWNGNGDSTEVGVPSDINLLEAAWTPLMIPDPRDTLTGHADWPNLQYDFRWSSTLSPLAAGQTADTPAELSYDEFLKIASFPPPRPYGRFKMDGILDSAAVVVGSNQGITLYAAVRGSHLYVATQSASVQGGDMFIVLAVPPGALRAAPGAKTGQVAAWSAVLRNRCSTNSSDWFDFSDSVMTCVSIDTSGTVLEGVVDFELLTGISPDSVYLAVGKYDCADGGSLIDQVPAGNGDSNIDAGEFLSLNPPPMGVRWRQQGEKIVPVLNGSVQAFVALSSDGNTALIGGKEKDDQIGGAWVYQRINNQWIQMGSRLVPRDAAGTYVAHQYVGLSADGNTAIVGGPFDNGGGGAAWIYVRTNGLWSQQGSKLVGTGSVGNAYQGRAVSISADGNTAVISGMNDDGGTGAAWVFVRENGIWSQQGGKLTPLGAIGRAGVSSVAISGDGNTLILGGWADDNERGAAWVFVRSGNLWNLQGTKLVGTGSAGDRSWQGASVALSYDGNTALVGGPADASSSGWGQGGAVGATWAFTRTNGVWSQDGNKLVGVDHQNGTVMQGSAVALSSDGTVALVGGPNDNVDGRTYTGATWVFKRRFDEWIQFGGKLVGRHGSPLENTSTTGQGSTLAISGDGSTALIGSIGDSLYRGAVWAFVSSDTIAFRITSISGTNLPGTAVEVRWTTFSEMNHCTFTVQRKSGQDADYTDLPNSSLPGRGAPDVSQSYQFTDNAVAQGTWTYRVKGVDLGGGIVFSDPVSVDVVTGIGETGMPKVFSLSQNYPNPWNPTTTIQFGVPHRAHVSLDVYNILGQRVARVVDETKEAGYHSIVFRANGLPSGVYVYRMQAADYVMVKKFLLLK